MRHADGIHIHIFDEVNVFNGKLFTAGTSAFGPERVAAYTFKLHFYAIYIKAIGFSELYSPETEFLFVAMYHFLPLFQFYYCFV